ncbi:MAG TPA: choice-of-anchor D domain-containing protein [Candidatus Kapabacteria bacterium]|nr:choice-of-anchor D domain-containing protein [Candidatus Kapabacteria bacterium]
MLLTCVTAVAQLDVHSRLTNFDTTLCSTRKCRTLVFKNTGAAPITITSADAPTAPFTVDASTPFTFPKTIAAGDSAAFTVCYAPTTAGRADTFKGFVNYGAASRDSFVLVGRTTAPALGIGPNALAFGTVQIFNTACLPVTITNTGDGPLAIGAITGVNPPFSVLTPPPPALAAGSSATITICFTPLAAGAANGTATLNYTICGTNTTRDIPLSGTGALPPRITLGPVLQITSDPTNFDTTLCGTSKCQTLTLRNIGSSPLNITQMDQLGLPFSLSSSTPLALPATLQPNEARTVQVCYSPTTAPKIDSQRVHLVADNRVSLSIAMVFDTSGSMTTPTGAGVSRIQAANAGGRVFLDNLVNDPARGIVDTAAVIRFSSAVVVAQDFTTNGTALGNAVPAHASGGTRLYDAVDQAISRLNARSQPGRRVIVLLTDGDDDGGFLQSRIDAIVTSAQNNVRIFTIGLGSGLSANGILTLQQLAGRTGGSSYFTNNPDTLVRIYQTIAQQLSHDIPGSFLLEGRAVAPQLTLNPPVVSFDSVRVGQKHCIQVTLGNSGDAPLQLAALPAGAIGFTIEGSSPLPAIPPGGTLNINACFQPARLRVHDTTFAFTYNSCRQPETLRLRGVGYDSVVIRLTDSIVAKPHGPNPDLGSIATFHVYLQDRIPVEYDVSSMSLTVAYNATLLFPTTPPAVTAGLAGSALTSVAQTSTLATDPEMRTTYTFSGTPIANPAPNAELLQLRYFPLLGNAVETPVTIVSATMADGNPKVGIVSPGHLRIDSICYLNQSLLNTRLRYNGKFALTVSTSGNQALVRFELPAAGAAAIQIFDLYGRDVSDYDAGLLGGGPQEVMLDVSPLPRGIYLVRVQSGQASDGTAFVITR